LSCHCFPIQRNSSIFASAYIGWSWEKLTKMSAALIYYNSSTMGCSVQITTIWQRMKLLLNNFYLGFFSFNFWVQQQQQHNNNIYFFFCIQK
jgi:hypothetical protein